MSMTVSSCRAARKVALSVRASRMTVSRALASGWSTVRTSMGRHGTGWDGRAGPDGELLDADAEPRHAWPPAAVATSAAHHQPLAHKTLDAQGSRARTRDSRPPPSPAGLRQSRSPVWEQARSLVDH